MGGRSIFSKVNVSLELDATGLQNSVKPGYEVSLRGRNDAMVNEVALRGVRHAQFSKQTSPPTSPRPD